MLLPSNLLGICFALTSAFIWGGGDFSGGLASRKNSSYQVLVLSGISGAVALLLVYLLLWKEPFPSLNSIGWAVLAGLAGTVGLTSLYRALSLGYTAVVAPTSAVICASLPVIFTLFTAGLPGWPRLAGFVFALAGIWLVSASHSADVSHVSRQGFLLACLAGTSFGCFFILLAQVENGSIFFPLLISRAIELAAGLLVLWLSRSSIPGWKDNPVALLAGVLDVAGNVFYLLAKQFTSLDVAAVLASLYPASTVILAGLVLKEKVSLRQWGGVGLCLLAITLITI
jgi:drug/metabolite transporter (DMT)-like permease